MARTRPEQVHAYRFVTRRIVSALLSGEPETTDLPMRRLGMALVGSLMVATIVFAAVGVYGLYRPGGGTPENGEIIVARESGALYVYTNDALYPVLNYASARLVAGRSTRRVGGAPRVPALERRQSTRHVPEARVKRTPATESHVGRR